MFLQNLMPGRTCLRLDRPAGRQVELAEIRESGREDKPQLADPAWGTARGKRF